MFEKMTIGLVQRAVAAYLPGLQTELVHLAQPEKLIALRVVVDEDRASDYFVQRGSWFWKPVSPHFETEAWGLGLADGTGMQCIAAIVARDVAMAMRSTWMPISADGSLGKEQLRSRGEADQLAGFTRFEESLDFLIALSEGKIKFTDGADALAAGFVADIRADLVIFGEESQPASNRSTLPENLNEVEKNEHIIGAALSDSVDRAFSPPTGAADVLDIEGDEEITEATYEVTMVDPWEPLTFSYDDANAFYRFSCPSQKLADNFESFLSRTNFLEVSFEKDSSEGVAMLARYLHPLNVWLALRGYCPAQLDLEAIEGTIRPFAPAPNTGRDHQAVFLRAGNGVRVTDEFYGVYVFISEPNVWLNSSLLMSAFDWSKEEDIFRRIKDYLYPLTFFLFVEDN